MIYCKVKLESLLSLVVIAAAAYVAAVIWSQQGVVLPVPPLECNPPYARENETDCCLDRNLNDICDRWEVTTLVTTSSSSTSTSTTSTTPIVPPTTSTICSRNADCGSVELERVCYRGNVHEKVSTPVCLHPERGNSKCVVRISGIHDAAGNTIPIEECKKSCVDGACT